MIKILTTLLIIILLNSFCYSQVSSTALQFDGIDDYVNIPSPSGFYSVVGTNPFTIEAWIRDDAPNPSIEEVILSSRNESGITDEGFKLSISFGNLSFWGPGAQTSVPVNLKDGLCHHVAVVRQGTTMSAYIDGVLYTSLVDPGDISSTQPVYIGKWYNQFGNFTSYFQGIIKELRVWSDYRTQSQIQNNMNKVVTYTNPLLVDYYRFNDGSGTTAFDYGEGGLGSNYGDIYGNASWTTACPVCVLPSATITPAGPTTFCPGGSVTLNAPATANRSYQWKKGGANIPGATSSSYIATTGGTYKVTVTNTATGCSKTSATGIVVTIYQAPAATITPQGPTTFCTGGSVVLSANTGAGLSHQWKKNGTNISGATASNYTATTAGTYKVKITNSTGCTKISAGVNVSVPCKRGDNFLTGSSLENEFDVTIFPNPNSGQFSIHFANLPASPVQILITDAPGKVMDSFETGKEMTVINKTPLDKGIYFLTAMNNKTVIVKKIVVR